jgi:hypothetical protein
MRQLIAALTATVGTVFVAVYFVTGGFLPAGLLGAEHAPPAPPSAPEHEPPAAAALDQVELPRIGEDPVRLEPPEDGAYFGAYDPDILRTGIAGWERQHGAELAIVHWYQGWGGEHPELNREWLDWVAEHGSVPMISWEPWRKPEGGFTDPDQEEFRLAVIADGRYDDYIRRWATEAADYALPMLVRPMHEMNGFWYPWSVTENDNSAADYVAAWRHIQGIFEEVGADNVSWVWAVNTLAGMPEEHRALDMASFYPGDEYVDWVSVVGFNYGTVRDWSVWRDVDVIFAETYEHLLAFGKPIMISEVGTVAEGGDPVGWTVETLDRLREQYPDVRAVVWFADERGDIDFRLSPEQAEAVRDVLGDAHWRPAVRTSAARVTEGLPPDVEQAPDVGQAPDVEQAPDPEQLPEVVDLPGGDLTEVEDLLDR